MYGKTRMTGLLCIKDIVTVGLAIKSQSILHKYDGQMGGWTEGRFAIGIPHYAQHRVLKS